MTVSITCPDCGQELATTSEQYCSEYPNGLEVWTAQLLSQHRESAHYEENHSVFTCHDCGQEYYECSERYLSEYPNGSDLAIGQAWRQHLECCPALPDPWDLWREEWERVVGRWPTTPHESAIMADSLGIEISLLPCPPDRDTTRWEAELSHLN